MTIEDEKRVRELIRDGSDTMGTMIAGGVSFCVGFWAGYSYNEIDSAAKLATKIGNATRWEMFFFAAVGIIAWPGVLGFICGRLVRMGVI